MIQKKTITTQVADEIRRRILTGEYKADDQLRQEHIAADMGVSKIPVREALHQLASEGFVTLAAHRGATVAEVSLEKFVELYELRARIESWLLAFAVPKMTEADFQAILAMADEFRRVSSEVDRRHESNWAFHKVLYAASGRPTTIEFLGRLHKQIERYTRMIMSLTGVEAKADREHRQLLQLCRQGDVDSAVDLLESHITSGSRSLVSRLRILGARRENCQHDLLPASSADGSKRA